jgi:peroxiredoxin
MKKTLALSAALLFGAAAAASAAPARDIQPVTVGQIMPDFTLPVFQGGELRLSALRGKNVLLIFPRGLAGENHWCHVCNYQYADLAELEKTEAIRKSHNLEICFVMPYGKEAIQGWVDAFPRQMMDIEAWKNPPDADKLDDKGKARLERLRKNMPNKYLYEKDALPLPFPILYDADRTVTKGLGIYATEWSGSKVDQNIPTVILLDGDGVVQLKYISQNTFDRPTAAYLLRVIEKLGK